MQQNRSLAGLSRREVLGLLNVGAVFGFISPSQVSAGLRNAGLQLGAGVRGKPLTLPPGAIIRTLLKDVSSDALGSGATLFHEHMSLTNFRMQPPRPRRFLEDVNLILDEVRAAGKDGISCIVDCGLPEMGRSLEALKQIAAHSGVHVVGSGGHYAHVVYPPSIGRMSDDEIAEELVQEVTEGHLGAFGEIGSSTEITPDERKVFRAVGKAHLQTGLPIITHTDNGKGAEKTPFEQLDILEAVGVKPQNVVIGHLDGFDNPQLHAAVAKRRAYVGFDRVGSERGDITDAVRVRNIVRFLDAGYADQLLLSSDFYLEEKLKREGGPGYAMTVTEFVPKLRQAGVRNEMLHDILVDNPRRLLAFVPKKS